MAKWTFYDYIEPSGRNPFGDWVSGLPPSAQAFIDARILQMAALDRWSEKWISKYKTTEKIYELRITFNKVQYRPLGIYAKNYSFILLGGDIEKDGALPRSTIEAVQRRQRFLNEEPQHVRGHQFY
jgi:hypothetical protein